MTPSSPEQQEANKDNYISTGIVIITVGKIWLFIWHAKLTQSSSFDATSLMALVAHVITSQRAASHGVDLIPFDWTGDFTSGTVPV